MLTAKLNSSSPTLTALLPYALSSKQPQELVQIAKDYFFLLSAALETAQALQAGRPQAFDPLVGENFCQARALKIATEWGKCFCSFTPKEPQIATLQQELRKRIDGPTVKQKRGGVQVFLKEFDLALTKRELFFIASYLLTVVKAESSDTDSLIRREKTDPKKLRVIAPLSSTYGDRLVALLRAKVAKASVEYVQKLAIRLNDRSCLAKLSQKFVQLHNKNLACLPFYRSTKVLMQTALKLKVPIILWTRQIALETQDRLRDVCLYYQSDGNRYKQKSIYSANFHLPVLIIQGSARRQIAAFASAEGWGRELKSHQIDPLMLIAAASADHPQYPGKSAFESEAKNDPELLHYKALARQKGLASDEPTTFFTNHFFADTIAHLKPCKRYFNQNLKEYHPFYRQVFLDQIRSFFIERGYSSPITWKHTEEKLTIESKWVSSLPRLTRWLNSQSFLMMAASCRAKFRHNSLILETKAEIAYSVDPFMLMHFAQKHPNRQKFLLDHIRFWGRARNKICNFLMQQEESYQTSDFIDALYEEHAYFTFSAAIVYQAIEKATHLPHLKEKAASILCKMAAMPCEID
jgi:hypothetical protein